MKKRLDMACVERGIFPTRVKAQAAAMAGDILVNGRVVSKAGFKVGGGDRIELVRKMPYVSRGGLKLKAALDFFGIRLKGKVCADIGVAAGGFSDCMLQEGASVVYGVDVGRGQVHEKVANNPGFVFMPETNARFLKADAFGIRPSFAAVDVSFISLRLVLGPLCAAMREEFRVIALIKPQFELRAGDLKKGIVRSEELRHKAVETLRNFIMEAGLPARETGIMESPVRGAKGNREFLWLLEGGK